MKIIRKEYLNPLSAYMEEMNTLGLKQALLSAKKWWNYMKESWMSKDSL